MPSRRIKSAERTLALFELFSKRQQPMTIGAIAKELAIPQPSASMLVRNLTELGYLDHNRYTRTFMPSIRVVLLGSWIPHRYAETGSLVKRLDELHHRVGGETAYIGGQNGAMAQLVLWMNSTNPEGLVVESGMFRSLTCSSVGRALMCCKSDTEIANWVRRCNAEATEDRFKVKLSEYLALIAQDRARGYSMTNGEIRPGLSAIAMTIPSPIDGAPLVVGVSAPVERMREKQDIILEALNAFKQSFEPVRRGK